MDLWGGGKFPGGFGAGGGMQPSSIFQPPSLFPSSIFQPINSAALELRVIALERKVQELTKPPPPPKGGGGLVPIKQEEEEEESSDGGDSILGGKRKLFINGLGFVSAHKSVIKGHGYPSEEEAAQAVKRFISSLESGQEPYFPYPVFVKEKNGKWVPYHNANRIAKFCKKM